MTDTAYAGPPTQTCWGIIDWSDDHYGDTLFLIDQHGAKYSDRSLSEREVEIRTRTYRGTMMRAMRGVLHGPRDVRQPDDEHDCNVCGNPHAVFVEPTERRYAGWRLNTANDFWWLYEAEPTTGFANFIIGR